MGLCFQGSRLYFGGKTFLGYAETAGGSFQIQKISDFFPQKWRRVKQTIKNFWVRRVGAVNRGIPYVDPQFHQMNIYDKKIFVSVTGRNEIWELNEELTLLRVVPVLPHMPDYHHLNNVFCDGENFYVCLNRYSQELGVGGFVKFDKNWVEIERKTIGWETHALCHIEGKLLHLCGSSGSIKPKIFHPHRAGFNVNNELVFEHNPDKFFCKDFSMNDHSVYLVGGEVRKRENRKDANGIVYILDRSFALKNEFLLPSTGGISGCRLSSLDYTDGPRHIGLP